ncbi:MAG: NB-ARC domain-containing protein [Gemmataceae bacterium]
MARQPRRKRPSYEPNKDYAKQLREKSGLSVVDFAKECHCGETTWRKMEEGERVDAETLRTIAERLKLHWYELLSAAARKRLGVGQPSAAPWTFPAGPPPSAALASAASLLGSRLFQLPPVPPDFTGREEQIQDLTRRLVEDAGRFPVAALRGMGGAGKTSLAIRVAHEVKNGFPDAQLYLNLRGTADGVKEHALTPAEAMSQVIHAIRPDAINLPQDEDILAGVYRGDLAGKRALILLDNAANEAQLRPLLTVPLPVRFLITSRHAQALDGVESIHIEGLSPEEAFSLLRRIMGPRGTRHELQELVRLCVQLPLALRVAGDFLRLKEDLPVSRYIKALEGEPHRWLKVGADPEKDVEAVLKLSSAQLVRDSVERGTRWHLLHIFEGDFDLPAAAAAWNADEDDLGVLNDLSDMENRSLITFDRSTRRYHLHDLLRPIAEGLFG